MAKQVKIQTAPDLIAKPVVNFTVEEYNAMVWNKGYDCIVESAIKCPCKTKNNDHLSTCQNCLGVGWVFVNPIQDRVLLSSLNYPTEYKEWSEQNLGTVNITTARRIQRGYMDKIVVSDSEAIHSEVLYPLTYDSNYFAYTIYDIVDIVEIFKFVSVSEKLQKLELNTDFTFDRNKVIFTSIPAQDFTISVRYKHRLQYYIIDIPHNVRNSYRKNIPTGRDELQLMPLNYIGRLSHYVLDSLNYAGDNIFDNSYQVI